MISQIQGHAIAKAIAAIRDDWDPAGILAALGKVQDRDPYDVLIAFARAARTPANRSPAVAALAGPHWQGEPVGSAPSRHPSAVPIGDLCMTHGIHRDSCGCAGTVQPPPWRTEAERQTRVERTAKWSARIRAELHGHPADEETP